MHIVVDRLAQVLAGEPAVLPLAAVTTKQPERASDMPSVSVTLDVVEEQGRGLGRIVRGGHGIVRNLQSVSVQSSPSFESETFDTSLTRYKLWPLPIRRNPDAPRGPFGGADVGVTNLTTGTPYTFNAIPAAADEFVLDPETGVLQFGDAQVPGEELEVEHWTMAWRDDIHAERYQGEMALSIWGASYAEVDAVTRRLTARLSGPPPLFKSSGFEHIGGSHLGDAQSDVFDPLVGTPFVRWRQALRYRFLFDTELGGEASAGGIIRRIDVNINDKLPDPFSITQ